MTILVFVRFLSFVNLRGFLASDKSQSQFSELYIVAWFIVLISILFCPVLAPLYCYFVPYRLIDGFNYGLCIIFVDRYAKGWEARSLNRSIILFILNYLEIIIGFSSLYLYTNTIADSATKQFINSPIEALYFSAVTITTLGYGDFIPISPLGKFLVIVETLMGIILLVLVIGTFLKGHIDNTNEKSG